VFYGNPSTGVASVSVKDVNWRERAAVWPTVALMIAMGVASTFWMHAIDLTVPAMAVAPEIALFGPDTGTLVRLIQSRQVHLKSHTTTREVAR
jgi:hypothetical protein